MLNRSNFQWAAPLAAAFLTMSLASGAFACPGKDCKDGQCEYKANSIAKQLGLEGERANEVDALQKSYRNDKKALRKQMHEQTKVLKKDYKNALKGILTAEELDKVEASMHHAKKSHKHMHDGKCKDGHCKHSKHKHSDGDSPRNCKTKEQKSYE